MPTAHRARRVSAIDKPVAWPSSIKYEGTKDERNLETAGPYAELEDDVAPEDADTAAR